jgi:hypothetical protein
MTIHDCFFQAWAHYIVGNVNSSAEWLVAAMMKYDRRKLSTTSCELS